MNWHVRVNWTICQTYKKKLCLFYPANTLLIVEVDFGFFFKMKTAVSILI